MRIFLTGGSGYLGGRIAQSLIDQGHRVDALVRRSGSAPVGCHEILGDLSDPNALIPHVQAAGGLIHCAFGHAEDFGEAVETEKAAITVFRDALAGSGAKIIVTSAAGVLGDTGSVPASRSVLPSPDFPAGLRGFLEHMALDQTQPLVTAMRLPILVYGNGGSQFVPMLIGAAQSAGRSICIGDGANRLSTAHVDDTAQAYLKALHHDGGGVFNVCSGSVSGLELAQAVGNLTKTPVESVTLEEAQASLHPFAALLLSMNFALDPDATQDALEWQPARPGLIEDVQTGSYYKKNVG